MTPSQSNRREETSMPYTPPGDVVGNAYTTERKLGAVTHPGGEVLCGVVERIRTVQPVEPA